MPGQLSKRENWLDACKGISIVLVVMGHIIDGNVAKGSLSGSGFEVLYNIIYLFHMPLFFILSGMAFAASKRKNLSDGKESCFNLLILYVFWSAFMYTFKTLLTSIANKVPTKSLIYYIVFQPVSPYWYLIVLLYFYLIYYIFVKQLSKKGMTAFLCISIIASSVVPTAYHIVLTRSEDLLYKIIYYLAFFTIGYYTYSNKDSAMETIKKGKIILPIFAVAFLFLYTVFFECAYYPFIKFVMSATVSLGILSAVQNIKMISDNKLLCYFGKNSLYIYLIHNYITVMLRTVYIRLGLNIPNVIYFIGCIVITLAMCGIGQIICRKIWPLDIFFKPIKTVKRFNFIREGKT